MSEKTRRVRWFLLGALSAGALGVLAGVGGARGDIRFGNGPFEINDVILTEGEGGVVHAWRARSRTDYETGATVTTVDYLGHGSVDEGSVTTYTALEPEKDRERLNGRVIRR